jgi:hypothetical protein
MFSYSRGTNGEILVEERDEVPTDREDGFARWRWEMEMRFVRGGDGDFDYETVDGMEEYDDREIEETEAEESWFDQEEALFVDKQGARSLQGGELQGETGIQDF